ncbi:MAG: tetratricopeptide repeat protein, partial [Planctomycetota bacterium]
MRTARKASMSRTIGLTAAGVVLLSGLVGCAGGHGKYTKERSSAAKLKLDAMKSATDYDMARQSFLAGDLNKALTRVDSSIRTNGEVAKSHVLRGRILNELGATDQSISAFHMALAIEEENVEAHYYLGVIYERLTDRESALRKFVEASEIEPNEAQYAVAAAEMMIDLDRIDEAEAFLTDREDTFRHNPGVRQTLGHIAMMRGDSQTAAEMFAEARLLAPEDTSVLEDLAHAYVAVADFGRAESAITKLLRGEPDRRDLQHVRARCLV